MKVVFDTNVYIGEALFGQAAERLVEATVQARWRIFVNDHILNEIERVRAEYLGQTRRFAILTRQRIARRASNVEPSESRHVVARDSADTPILRLALQAGADYLVTNDRHLLALNPYEGPERRLNVRLPDHPRRPRAPIAHA